jgi:hypothetical protein
VNAGLFCASAPAIKPLLRKVAPGLLSSLGGTSTYTHSGKRTYGQGSRFGTAQGSRHGGRRSDRHELRSNTELDELPHGFGKDASLNITNTFWKGDDSSVTKDSESERRVLDRTDQLGQIRKTVSVMVTKQETMDDGERSSGSSVKKFEHV